MFFCLTWDGESKEERGSTHRTLGRKEAACPGREGSGYRQACPVLLYTNTAHQPAPHTMSRSTHTGAPRLCSLPTRLTEALDMAVGRGDPASSFLQKGSEHHHLAACWRGDSSLPYSNSDQQPVKAGMPKIRPGYE